jgi:methylglutaconyl-CoA hydratase
MTSTLLSSLDPRGIATVTFNRPDKANSYDQDMLEELGAALDRWQADPAVRVIVLRGNGKHFSAGAAIGESGDRASGGTPKRGIIDVCSALDAMPKPTIAAVLGACIGGAVALASCCDVVIATNDAHFALPEVRLGFAPGPLIPFLVRAMGFRPLRRYGLSGERFTADDAQRIGLVHQLCGNDALDRVLADVVENFLMAAPGAVTRTKQVLRTQAGLPSAEQLRELQAAFDAAANSGEAVEGRASFKERRKPSWYRTS